MRNSSPSLIPHSVRLPVHILEAIREQARVNRRSINSEIIIGLEKAFEAETETAPGDEIGVRAPDAAHS